MPQIQPAPRSGDIVDLPPTDWQTVQPAPKPDRWRDIETLIVWIVTAAVLGLAGLGLQSLLSDPAKDAARRCGTTSTGVDYCLRDR